MHVHRRPGRPSRPAALLMTPAARPHSDDRAKSSRTRPQPTRAGNRRPRHQARAGAVRIVGRAAHLSRGFDGVIDYEPAELVLTVECRRAARRDRTAARAAQPDARLRAGGSRADSGAATGQATIGGVIAAGARRLPAASRRGGVRDHLPGLPAASTAAARSFKAGGKVVKNVTGYDLPKLMAGSLGHAVRPDGSDAEGPAAAAGARHWRC